jgi:hypothetical protein
MPSEAGMISQRIRALERAAPLNLYNHNDLMMLSLDLFDVRFANSD